MAKTPTCTWHRTVSLVVALLVAHSAPTAAPWEPNETQASAEKELIDYEFSQTRGQFTWVDALGRLWLGNVNPNTGLFDPIDGRGTLVDPDAITVADAFLTFNGPEWAKSARGDQIAYTKFVAGKPHNSRTARIAVAKQAKDGSWTYAFLSPNAPRFAPYASENDDDLAPIITYVDNVGNHYWRETGRANTEQLIAVAEPSSIPIRSVRGARSLLPSIAVAGVKQVHTYDVDTKALQQLTFDDGNKAGSWMWRAPEFGNEFVLTTVVNATVCAYTARASRRRLPKACLRWKIRHRTISASSWNA